MATRHHDRERHYNIIVQNIIIDMNRCLHWDISEEEFYFISYSSRNVMQAETLKRLLQDNNIHVWIAPDGIPQGREYPLVIPTALKLAKTFVLLLTPDSAKSQWVRRELAIAIGNSVDTKVKVILSEGFTISDIRNDNELEFLLDRVQIKYEYSDLIHSSDILNSFISE
uniref:toll/interleukin-1 receptor domain-containing protein n=1 Tax=Prevotella sp. TaxID=59823 RepID=UPI004025F7E0